MREKYDNFDTFKNFCVKFKNEKDCNIGKIVRIQSDHRKESNNVIYANFYNKHGISYEFSTPKNPIQDGVLERKNCTLQKMACAMLNSKKYFLRNGVSKQLI